MVKENITFDSYELEDILFVLLWSLDYVNGDHEQKEELKTELNRTARELRAKLKGKTSY